jgi:serine protease Do
MKLQKIVGAVAAATGVLALAIVAAPSVTGQANPPERPQATEGRRVDIFGFGGSSIGASIRDVDETDRQRTGVLVEEVRPGSAAEKAGLRVSDIITRFDGQEVRGARQFSRLVQETPAGRTVVATVQRDGKSADLKITPEDSPRTGIYIDGDRLSRSFDAQRFDDQMGRLRDRLRDLPFELNLDLDLPASDRPRLGVSVQALTPQLAAYFGTKEGVLVSAVTDDSPASRAGLKAGDVIVSVNGQNISSRADLTRAVSGASTGADTTIGIVRDKKETSVKARLDDVRARRPAPRRPIRPVGLTPA